jgi:hypothetical protein
VRGESECAAAEPRHGNREEESSRVEENSRSARFGTFEGRSRVDFEEGKRSENEKSEKKGRRSKKGTCREKRARGRHESHARLLWKKGEERTRQVNPLDKRGFEMLGDSSGTKERRQARNKEGTRHLGTHEMRGAEQGAWSRS